MSGHRRQLKRIEDPSHVRYLTCSCYRRLALFNNDQIKDAFMQRLALARQRMGFELFAWVIMPEHVHLLLRPASNSDVAGLLRHLKAPFGREVIARWRALEAPILDRILDHAQQPRFWQPGGGYDRNIVTRGELLEKMRYIHANPVRRGLVDQAVQWRWSSARWYDGCRNEVVPIDPIG